MVAKIALGPIKAQLELQDEVLAITPDEEEQWTGLAQRANALRGKTVQGLGGIQGQIGLIQLEVSRGRTGPDDLHNIFEKVKELGTRAYGLDSFVVRLELLQLRPPRGPSRAA